MPRLPRQIAAAIGVLPQGTMVWATDTKAIVVGDDDGTNVSIGAGGGGGITQLTGGVTAGPGSGSVAATVATVGGATAANVATATSAANAATSANTVNTIVKRDASGDIAVSAIAATDLDLAGSTITNVGNAAAGTDAVAYGQVSGTITAVGNATSNNTPNTIMSRNGNGSSAIGRIGIDLLTFPNPLTQNLTVDNTEIDVTSAVSKSFVILSSDSAVAADRTFTISGANDDGQMLFIIWNSANAGQLLNGGNLKMSGDWTPTQYDTIHFMYTSGFFFELGRSANS